MFKSLWPSTRGLILHPTNKPSLGFGAAKDPSLAVPPPHRIPPCQLAPPLPSGRTFVDDWRKAH